MRKIYLTLLVLVCLSLGVFGGVFYRSWRMSKTVAFRISTNEQFVDYDLKSALNYLQYEFERQGYRVLPWRYQGDFYFNEADNAAINVFVRSFDVIWDARMNKKAFNIYYLHRFVSIYAEEFRNYDYYLSSQKNLLQALSFRPDVGYFEGGAVPHDKLSPNYLYDVLYISEHFENDYINYLENQYRVKIFDGLKFGQLSQKEREKELAQARLVVYDVEQSAQDDEDYVPYAVYDILSYGRPLVTNYKKTLAEIGQGNIYMFVRLEDMGDIIQKVLNMGSNELESRAEMVRKVLLLKQKKQTALPKKMK